MLSLVEQLPQLDVVVLKKEPTCEPGSTFLSRKLSSAQKSNLKCGALKTALYAAASVVNQEQTLKDALTAMVAARCAESSKAFLDVSSTLPPARAVTVKGRLLPTPMQR